MSKEIVAVAVIALGLLAATIFMVWASVKWDGGAYDFQYKKKKEEQNGNR